MSPKPTKQPPKEEADIKRVRSIRVTDQEWELIKAIIKAWHKGERRDS